MHFFSTSSDSSSVDDNMSHTSNNSNTEGGPLSPRSSNLASRIQQRMRRTRPNRNKFDAMAKEEQKHLEAEIQLCKSYVKSLQQKTNQKRRASRRASDLWAKEHASDLLEEISVCEEELCPIHCPIHSIDLSVSGRRRRGSTMTMPRAA